MLSRMKKIIAIALSGIILLSFLSGMITVSATEAIYGNGTNGITINIYGSPYTDYKAKDPTWGKYAYTSDGCAWFASARVCELTGKTTSILSGTSWYNSGYSTYGFSRGRSISAKALACYTGHVTVVEAINGNTVTVSEGGMPNYPNNGYCAIRTTTVSALENRSACGSFLGYVYLGVGNTPIATGNNPTGCVDIVESKSSGTIHVCGWAFDLDSPTKPLEIHVYIGGPAGSANAEGHPGIIANQSRPDVANVYSKYNVGNNHGFDATIKTSKSGNQPVYIYAINIGGGNSNPLIGGKPYTTNIAPAYNPQGYLDNVDSPSQGKLHVRGWAFDKDNVNTTLTVHIYVGGPAGSGAPCYAITANKERPDVNKVFAGVGNNHGYDETINVSKSGNQKVYAYALNIGGGTDNPNLTNSPKSVNIIPDTEKPVISNVTFSQVSLKGYRVTCNVSDNVAVQTVKFPSWTTKTDENGKNQDDLIWHVGKIDGNQASFYVKSSDHKNETGTYITHIYAYDVAGKETSLNAGTVTLTDTPSEKASTTYNGNKYTVYNSGKNWGDAKTWCEANGGHLVTISDEQEWNVVKNLLKKYNGVECWLGAEKTNETWKWVDNTQFEYNDWGKNQPDNSGGTEKYLGTWGGGYINSYYWNDFSYAPDDVGGFVCEFEKSQDDTQPITTKPNETSPTTNTSKELEPTGATEPATVVTEPPAEKVEPTTAPPADTVKKPNPVKVTAKTKSVKVKALKAKKQTVKPLTIKNAKGAVTVVKVKKGTTAKIYKKITVNRKTGAITFKKGNYAKKTYTVKLKITAAGNSDYNAKTVSKTVKIKIE